MPQVGGKRFPYTRKGKAQAKVAILKRIRGLKKRAGGDKNPYGGLRRPGSRDSVRITKPVKPLPERAAQPAQENYAERQARFARREEKGLPTGFRDPRKRAMVAKNKMRRQRGFGGYSSLREAVSSGKFKSIRRKSPFNYKD